jgi:hypothetical protein
VPSELADQYDECPICENDFDNVLREGSSQVHEVRDSGEMCKYQPARSSFRHVFIHLEGSA